MILYHDFVIIFILNFFEFFFVMSFKILKINIKVVMERLVGIEHTTVRARAKHNTAVLRDSFEKSENAMVLKRGS